MAITAHNMQVALVDPLSARILGLIQIPEWDIVGTLALAYSPDGSLLASGGYEQRLDVWDTGSFRRVAEIPSETLFRASGAITGIQFTQVPNVLLVSNFGDAGGLTRLDLHSMSARRLFDGHVNDFTLLPGGHQAVLALSTIVTAPPVLLLDLQTLAVRGVIAEGEVAASVDVSSDGLLVAAVIDGQLHVWDRINEQDLILPELVYQGTTLAVRFSPLGRLVTATLQQDLDPWSTLVLVWNSPETEVQLDVWDTQGWSLLGTTTVAGATGIDFSPTTGFLVIASLQEPVSIWELP